MKKTVERKTDKRRNRDAPMPPRIMKMLANLAMGKLHCPLCNEVTALGSGEIQENEYIKAYVVKCAEPKCREVILAVVMERKEFKERKFDKNRKIRK